MNSWLGRKVAKKIILWTDISDLPRRLKDARMKIDERPIRGTSFLCHFQTAPEKADC
jgi:hypothetical protein